METVIYNYSWAAIKNEMSRINFHPIPEIITKYTLKLLKNKELNLYIIIHSKDYIVFDIYELRFISSGHITKPARPTLVYE